MPVWTPDKIHLDLTPYHEGKITTLCGLIVESSQEWENFRNENEHWTSLEYIQDVTCKECRTHPHFTLYEIQSTTI